MQEFDLGGASSLSVVTLQSGAMRWGTWRTANSSDSIYIISQILRSGFGDQIVDGGVHACIAEVQPDNRHEDKVLRHPRGEGRIKADYAALSGKKVDLSTCGVDEGSVDKVSVLVNL